MSLSPRRLMFDMAEVDRVLSEMDTDDAKLLLDTVEGQTQALEDFDVLLSALVQDMAYVESLAKRQERLDKRVQKLREVLSRMMEKMHQRSIERDQATVSLADGPQSVHISDQAAVPDGFWRRSIDKRLLGELLKKGQDIPGASLTNGPPVLRVYRA